MAETIKTVNKYLLDNFGMDTDDTEPIFRVVWSDDQREMRLTRFTDLGIELIIPEVRELPKYPWIKGAYVLERRVIVPEINIKEIPAVKKSYEPLWVFVGSDGHKVPPTVQGCKFVIDCLYAAIGKTSMAKYKDPREGLTPEEAYDKKQAEIDVLENELFGDESGLKQATINCGSAIIVPGNYDKVH